jgi:hypothetical protein
LGVRESSLNIAHKNGDNTNSDRHNKDAPTLQFWYKPWISHLRPTAPSI